MKNLAFIDGQNLHMGTKSSIPSWEIDLGRFRIYLKEKYKVDMAYYFIGYYQEENNGLYNEIRESGFILKFKEHNPIMLEKKKGNVDSDIIFDVMRRLYLGENFEKIVLVSGDGDYKMLVDFLIEENKFEKILFPNKKFASSLYKKIGKKYIFDYLENENTKRKISK